MSADLELVVAYMVLVVAACCRGGTTYALGRGGRRAGSASRAGRLLERPMFRRSEAVVARFGAPAVSLSFLTVGVQTAVNLSAGFLRMPLRFYLPALFVGALLWAGLYLSVGVALVRAWTTTHQAWLLVALAVVALVAVATAGARRLAVTRRPLGHEVAAHRPLAETR